jgi:hypothetical protein
VREAGGSSITRTTGRALDPLELLGRGRLKIRGREDASARLDRRTWCSDPRIGNEFFCRKSSMSWRDGFRSTGSVDRDLPPTISSRSTTRSPSRALLGPMRNAVGPATLAVEGDQSLLRTTQESGWNLRAIGPGKDSRSSLFFPSGRATRPGQARARAPCPGVSAPGAGGRGAPRDP